MVGVSALTGSRLVTGVRNGLFEQSIRRLQEYAARTGAEELARTTWTEDARGMPAGRDDDARYAGLTPVRWTRLA